MSVATPKVRAMTLTLGMVTIDTHDADALADWWAEQMGAEVMERNDGWYVVLQGGTLPIRLSFQKVEDPTPGKNKVHLDIHTDGDLDVEVARWVEAGATIVEKRNAGDFHWVTLADPDGNEFCIAPG
jgi:catechol-2,3-dioxygenase